MKEMDILEIIGESEADYILDIQSILSRDQNTKVISKNNKLVFETIILIVLILIIKCIFGKQPNQPDGNISVTFSLAKNGTIIRKPTTTK